MVRLFWSLWLLQRHHCRGLRNRRQCSSWGSDRGGRGGSLRRRRDCHFRVGQRDYVEGVVRVPRKAVEPLCWEKPRMKKQAALEHAWAPGHKDTQTQRHRHIDT